MKKITLNKKLLMNNKVLFGIAGAAIVLLLLLLILQNINKTVTCSSTSDQSKNGYILSTEYVIKSKNKIVKSVNIKETITSKDEKLLSNFEKQFKEQYEYNKKAYGGYKFKVTNKNGKVTTNVEIDYSKFDMEKFTTNNVAMKQYTKNNKLTLEGAKKLYESTGATCK